MFLAGGELECVGKGGRSSLKPYALGEAGGVRH